MNCTTITAAMKFATSKLSAAGIQEPRLDSKILLCHAAKIDQLTILSNPERLLSSETIKLFDPKTQISHKEINQIENHTFRPQKNIILMILLNIYLMKDHI